MHLDDNRARLWRAGDERLTSALWICIVGFTALKTATHLSGAAVYRCYRTHRMAHLLAVVVTRHIL